MKGLKSWYIIMLIIPRVIRRYALSIFYLTSLWKVLSNFLQRLKVQIFNNLDFLNYTIHSQDNFISTPLYMFIRLCTIITFQAIDWFLGIYAMSWFENQLIAWTMIMFSHFASYQILQQIMRCSSKQLAHVLKESEIDNTQALYSLRSKNVNYHRPYKIHLSLPNFSNHPYSWYLTVTTKLYGVLFW